MILVGLVILAVLMVPAVARRRRMLPVPSGRRGRPPAPRTQER
jgi:hypothetical protein